VKPDPENPLTAYRCKGGFIIYVFRLVLTWAVTASFEYKNSKVADFLNNFPISAENDIVLMRRTVENTDKSKAFINDSQVNIRFLI
jgi:hypothetical protein